MSRSPRAVGLENSCNWLLLSEKTTPARCVYVQVFYLTGVCAGMDGNIMVFELTIFTDDLNITSERILGLIFQPNQVGQGV